MLSTAINVILLTCVLGGLDYHRRRKEARDIVGRLGRRMSTWSPLEAVVATLAIAVVLFVATLVIFWHVLGVGPDFASKGDVTRLALTVAGGLGVIVALVVAYRRQRDSEQARFIERFSAAAAQLGDKDPAIRIAGVYAMAGAADETANHQHRQQCIDVLCGYLRLPYQPSHGANYQTQVMIREPRGSLGKKVGRETETVYEYRQNDREVRNTIVRVIVAHLQGNAEQPWSSFNYDFTGAHFEDVSFARAAFSGNANFEKVTFSGESTSFDAATFSGETISFAGANFSAVNTRFEGATFSGKGTTSFAEAAFSGDIVSFDDARFTAASTRFQGSTFGSRLTTFQRTTFTGTSTLFDDTTFSREVTSFGGARFTSTTTRFNRARFTSRRTSFSETTFDGDISFVEARFGRRTSFGRAAFSGFTSFHRATFGHGVGFGEARFTGTSSVFGEVTFSGHTSFRNATFTGDTWFDGANFIGQREIIFEGTTFSGPQSFRNTTFSGHDA